jgi:hypothetical protein
MILESQSGTGATLRRQREFSVPYLAGLSVGIRLDYLSADLPVLFKNQLLFTLRSIQISESSTHPEIMSYT